MNTENENTLRGLFAADRERRQNAMSEEERKNRDVERDMLTFAAIREEIIKPELDEIAHFVRSEGWDSVVAVENEKDIRKDVPSTPTIVIYFSEGKVSPFTPEREAYVRFGCVAGYSKVSVSESNILDGRGGSSGSGTTVDMTKITGIWVNDRVTKLVAELLKNAV